MEYSLGKPSPNKYAQVEDERRFLLNTLPLSLHPESMHQRIIDHYLQGTRLRLRRIESPSGEILALKFGQKYQASDQPAHLTLMTNIYLNESEYQLLSSLGGLPLVKRRYPYLYQGDNYSIDVFEGNLEGLILAEIQVQPGRDITMLPMPPFAKQEVTDDTRFQGGVLAMLTKEEFQQWSSSW